MSRTYKHQTHRLVKDKWSQDQITCIDFKDGRNVYYTIYAKTTKTKKRKEVDTEDHWMTTPSWFVHMFMTKPARRKDKVWERKVLLSDIEEADCPNLGKKPHKYYW